VVYLVLIITEWKFKCTYKYTCVVHEELLYRMGHEKVARVRSIAKIQKLIQ
jgi:hypothetical protein